MWLAPGSAEFRSQAQPRGPNCPLARVGRGGTVAGVATVKCRDTGRRPPHAILARGAVVATMVGLLGAGASGLGYSRPRRLAPRRRRRRRPPRARLPISRRSTPPRRRSAPIEATLSQEEQQSSALDNRYTIAVRTSRTPRRRWPSSPPNWCRPRSRWPPTSAASPTTP